MRPNCHRWVNGLVALASIAVLTTARAEPSTPPAVPALLAYEALTRTVYVDRCERDRCAQLDIQTLRFKSQPEFNQFLDSALVSMAWQSETEVAPYREVTELEAYFESAAKPGELLSLKVSVLRQTPQLVVLSLTQYRFEGGAHGESAQQLINWLLPQDRVVSLKTALLPAAMPAYTAALKSAHRNWIADQARAGAIDDAAAFSEQWPFVLSDNVALMADGLMVSYPRYAIGPGSFGEPIITLPYVALDGVLKPEILTQTRAPRVAPR